MNECTKLFDQLSELTGRLTDLVVEQDVEIREIRAQLKDVVVHCSKLTDEVIGLKKGVEK